MKLNKNTSIDITIPSTESGEILRIGYYWARDKDFLPRFNRKVFTELLRKSNLKLERLNFDKPLEDQGPFAAIIHKMVNLVAKGKLGNERANEYLAAFKMYVEKHPETIIIDPLHRIEPLISRLKQYNKLNECVRQNLEGVCVPDIFIPTYVEFVNENKDENLAKLLEKEIEFPIICKPLIAQGTAETHKLTIIMNPSGLAGVKPPCIAQAFINHNAMLYKMYIVGDSYNIIEKPSLKNMMPGNSPNIHFTGRICRESVGSTLTKMDSFDCIGSNFGMSKRHVAAIFKTIPRALGLQLLGIDIIVEKSTGRHAIIDLNMFPGYAEVGDLIPRFRDLIISKVQNKSKQSTYTPRSPSAFSEEAALQAANLAHSHFDESDYETYQNWDEDDEYLDSEGSITSMT